MGSLAYAFHLARLRAAAPLEANRRVSDQVVILQLNGIHGILHSGDCALYYGAGAGPIFSYEEIVDLELCPIVSSDVKGEDLGVGRQNPSAPAHTEVIWPNGFADCLIMIEISIIVF